MNRKFVFCMTLMLLSGFTASCGFMPGTSKSTPTQNSEKENVQAQVDALNNNQPTSGSAVAIPPPVALPPSYGDRPNGSNDVPGHPQTLPNGLPALQAKGVNVDNLFAQNVSDTDQRFNRLENAVMDLRREFESFKPAIVRLVAVEADIQDLIEQLDVLLQTEPAPVAAAPTQLAPVPQLKVQDQPNIETAPPPTATSAPQPKVDTSGAARVSALRVGQHSGKVRLVMDASKKTPYTIDLDNQENILIIELPEAQWTASSQKTFGTALLNAYTTESINNGSGTRVILTLKKPTTLMKSEALPPSSNPYYRIYADLKN